MAHYLVTGGCGFIGSHLADALIAAGHQVRILDDLSTGRRENAPAGAELMVGDIVEPATVAEAMVGVAGCFHLAAVASVARSNEDWLGTHRVNLDGTINIYDAARHAKAPIPVVYASSAAVYGDNTRLPLAETEPARPLTAYGADKYGCELHARVAGRVHGVPTMGLRFFNVYGPRQDPNSPYSGVISIFAQRAASGQRLTIHGDGSQVRDFIYVADVVRFLIAAMARTETDAPVLNVCTGQPTAIMELAQLIASLSGGEGGLVHEAARVGDIPRSLGDPRQAVQSLDLAATTPLREGLRQTLTAIAAPN